jgi:plastocyanin
MKRFGYLAAFALFVVVAGTALAACGDDNNDNGNDNATTTTRPTTAATSAATAARTGTAAATTPAAGGGAATSTTGATTLNVTAKDFSFDIDKDSIPAGGTIDVAFKNDGQAPHTITFYTDEDYTQKVSGGDSDIVNGGQSKNFTFTAPSSGDELYYRCEIHPTQMKGELKLQ